MILAAKSNGLEHGTGIWEVPVLPLTLCVSGQVNSPLCLSVPTFEKGDLANANLTGELWGFIFVKCSVCG